jgi:chemotaxis protein methyltransferase CheR
MQQISDSDCVSFLQWALPKMKFRWKGFRKVRKQVCKRIKRRIQLLGLADYLEYRIFLENYPQEWKELESFCYISISHFYRDKNVYQIISSEIIPELIKNTLNRGEKKISCWSAGCCSGEEPYTLQILWKMEIEPELTQPISFSILATDINSNLLDRAQKGIYRSSSLKHLPDSMCDKSFELNSGCFALKAAYRQNINFLLQDIREEMPKGPFHIILCRNLVFTYFKKSVQCEVLESMVSRLIEGGILIIGSNESLPLQSNKLPSYKDNPCIYLKER